MAVEPFSARSLQSLLSAGLVAGLLTVAGSGWAADGHDAHRGHQAHGTASLALNHGQQWPTDQALRQGMANMRTAMAGALPLIHEGRYAAAQYAALAKRLDNEVAFIVTNCRLEPAADAQLHGVLADLTAGVGRMKGSPTAAIREEAALRVVQALNAYGEHFDHPGWQPLGH